MVRGKYAAKANGQRAETAGNAVVALRGQIEQIRRDHVAEVASLKAEISSLQGQLLREVREAAATEVERVRTEAHVAIESERVDRREAAKGIAILLGDAKIRREVYPELAKLLGFELSEFLAIGDAGDLNRAARRLTNADIRHSDELRRQQRTRPAIISGHPGARE